MKYKATIIITWLSTAMVISAAPVDENISNKNTQSRKNTTYENIFNKMDSNADGVLSKQEFFDGQKKIRQLRTQKNNKKNQKNPNAQSNDDVLKKYDLNGDGKLSDEEKLAMLAEHNKQRGAEE